MHGSGLCFPILPEGLKDILCDPVGMKVKTKLRLKTTSKKAWSPRPLGSKGHSEWATIGALISRIGV